ncbi:ABC transporter substrate-binding protein [Dietzia lutea]|uniref:SsuA/THI5-like domain-containing protein n=1 Tax=Dietzia lutea TaxID=546160 RepID=A0A2S1R9W7_9ACTN|nr:ABC transporter substrate-binding protein [Dietzia lutea]AWH93088.1 hypothetical protein A6035_13925 [Dietzia lutea]
MSIKKTGAVGAALALVLAGCGNDSSDTGGNGGETETITVATASAQSYTIMHLAEELGMFEDAGIGLEQVSIERGAGPILAAMSNNSVDVAVQSPVVAASANNAGNDMRLFCGTASSLNAVILARPDSDIPEATPENWREALQSWSGRTMGIIAEGGAIEGYVRSLLKEAEVEDVELIAVGMGEQATNALLSGQIDLLFSVPFFSQQAQDRTKEVFSWAEDAPDEEITNSTQGAWMAKKEWLDNNSELAERFCSVMGDTIDEMFDNPEVLRDVLRERFNLQGDVLEASAAEDGPLALQSSDLACDAVANALEGAVDAGLLPSDTSTDCSTLLWEGVQ